MKTTKKFLNLKIDGKNLKIYSQDIVNPENAAKRYFDNNNISYEYLNLFVEKIKKFLKEIFEKEKSKYYTENEKIGIDLETYLEKNEFEQLYFDNLNKKIPEKKEKEEIKKPKIKKKIKNDVFSRLFEDSKKKQVKKKMKKNKRANSVKITKKVPEEKIDYFLVDKILKEVKKPKKNSPEKNSLKKYIYYNEINNQENKNIKNYLKKIKKNQKEKLFFSNKEKNTKDIFLKTDKKFFFKKNKKNTSNLQTQKNSPNILTKKNSRIFTKQNKENLNQNFKEKKIYQNFKQKKKEKKINKNVLQKNKENLNKFENKENFENNRFEDLYEDAKRRNSTRYLYNENKNFKMTNFSKNIFSKSNLPENFYKRLKLNLYKKKNNIKKKKKLSSFSLKPEFISNFDPSIKKNLLDRNLFKKKIKEKKVFIKKINNEKINQNINKKRILILSEFYYQKLRNEFNDFIDEEFLLKKNIEKKKILILEPLFILFNEIEEKIDKDLFFEIFDLFFEDLTVLDKYILLEDIIPKKNKEPNFDFKPKLNENSLKIANIIRKRKKVFFKEEKENLFTTPSQIVNNF